MTERSEFSEASEVTLAYDTQISGVDAGPKTTE